MNKKLYFLDEDEKNRILNLHESRTKKQYLINEQKYEYSQQKATSTPTVGPERKKWDDRTNRVKTLDAKCTNANPNDKSPLYKELGDWMDIKGTSTIWGTGTLEGILKKITSLNQYCELSATLKSKGTPTQGYFKKSLGEFLKSKITQPASWIQYFEKPLTKILKQAGLETLDVAATAGLSKKGWEKYPCVTNSINLVAVKLKDGSVGYEGGGFRWYGNGRKQNLQTGEMSDYHCGTDGKVKEGRGTDSAETPAKEFANVEPVSGIGVVIPSAQTEIPTLMKMAGMEGQPINQDTINKLYDILSKK